MGREARENLQQNKRFPEKHKIDTLHEPKVCVCMCVCAHFVNTKEEKGQEKPQKYSGPHHKFWGFYFDKLPNFTLKHFF